MDKRIGLLIIKWYGSKNYLLKNKIWLANFSHHFYSGCYLIFHLPSFDSSYGKNILNFAVKYASSYNQIPLFIFLKNTYHLLEINKFIKKKKLIFQIKSLFPQTKEMTCPLWKLNPGVRTITLTKIANYTQRRLNMEQNTNLYWISVQ